MKQKHVITFEELQLVKEMITKPVVCWITIISKKHYKMTGIDLSEQQALDATPKTMKQTNLTGNLSGVQNRVMIFIIKEVKESILDFPQKTMKVLKMCPTILFCTNMVSI